MNSEMIFLGILQCFDVIELLEASSQQEALIKESGETRKIVTELSYSPQTDIFTIQVWLYE